jgi:hypothetical protein
MGGVSIIEVLTIPHGRQPLSGGLGERSEGDGAGGAGTPSLNALDLVAVKCANLHDQP